jgi:hypothetical protein
MRSVAVSTRRLSSRITPPALALLAFAASTGAAQTAADYCTLLTMFNIDLVGYATSNGGKPTALPGIDDQAVMASPPVARPAQGQARDRYLAGGFRRQRRRAALAAALAAKAADKIT